MVLRKEAGFEVQCRRFVIVPAAYRGVDQLVRAPSSPAYTARINPAYMGYELPSPPPSETPQIAKGFAVKGLSGI